jgi:hypothetical protein
MVAFAALHKIDDPRDNLERAKRPELARYAKASGISEFTFNGMTFKVDEAPAIVTRQFLRARGLTNIRVPHRPLGAQNAVPASATPQPSNAVAVDAAADLARQFQTQTLHPAPSQPAQAAPPARPKRLVERPRSEINLLRDECKAKGIKMERRDNLATLKAKIEAHGKIAPQLRQ